MRLQSEGQSWAEHEMPPQPTSHSQSPSMHAPWPEQSADSAPPCAHEAGSAPRADAEQSRPAHPG